MAEVKIILLVILLMLIIVALTFAEIHYAYQPAEMPQNNTWEIVNEKDLLHPSTIVYRKRLQSDKGWVYRIETMAGKASEFIILDEYIQ